MNIRPAQEKDIPAIDRLLSQVLEIHAQARPDLFISGTRKYTDAELKEILHDASRPIYVAVNDEDSVIGYAFCILEKTDAVNMKAHETIYIDDLCVDQNIRHQHIGQKLVDYVMAQAKAMGCYHVTLNVWEGNDNAKAFYERMGFQTEKTMLEKMVK